MNKETAITYLRAIKEGLISTISERGRNEALDVAIESLESKGAEAHCYLGSHCTYQTPVKQKKEGTI